MKKDIAESIAIIVATAIRNERERIAEILENSELEYRFHYGHGGRYTLDWNTTMQNIAEKIRKG